MPLLSVSDLRTSFYLRSGTVRAVAGVSFEVQAGEVLGIVGESGCGKSVLCLSLLRLIPQPPGRIEAGTALLDGSDLLRMPADQLRVVRGNRVSMVFQDPATSLNPFMRIVDQVAEPLLIHRRVRQTEARSAAIATLEQVGIADAARRSRAYPHEFSGGMRQRAMIAMALITDPALLIADEPTTALDVTVQAQILSLITRLRQERGLSVVFVTHDLGIVAGLCDRVLVMYAGRIVESGTTADVYRGTAHPYTRALLASLPARHLAGETLKGIPGAPPDLSSRIDGCPFAPRCEFASPGCADADMQLGPVGEGHASACARVLAKEIAL